MKFQLQKLTTYDDESLVAEIHRVALLIPDGPLKSSDFDRLSKVHSSTLRHRFGNWKLALAAAGVQSRFDNSTEAWSRDEVIQALQSVAKKNGVTHVSKTELLAETGISDRPIRRIFGSYRAALLAAGLHQSPLGKRYTDEECYENLLSTWMMIGRQPRYSEMKSFPSKIGPKAYVGRWGSWRAALSAFVTRANQDLLTNTQEESSMPQPNKPIAAVRRRTSRGVSLGLRYAVLLRDGARCVLCHRTREEDKVELHVDHIFPWSKGGETVLDNLRMLCSDCNLGKSSSIEQA